MNPFGEGLLFSSGENEGMNPSYLIHSYIKHWVYKKKNDYINHTWHLLWILLTLWYINQYFPSLPWVNKTDLKQPTRLTSTTSRKTRPHASTFLHKRQNNTCMISIVSQAVPVLAKTYIFPYLAKIQTLSRPKEFHFQ